jgi:HlyD family secretion protein
MFTWGNYQPQIKNYKINKNNKKMKKKIVITVIITAIIAVVGLLGFTFMGNKKVQYETEIAAKGNLSVTVMATGYIQPVEEVEVGTQVSGVIEKLYADYNSHVKKGQLLAELDKLTLKEQLNQAMAQLSKAQSELNLANRQYDRVKQLYESKAATEVALEEAINRKELAEMTLKDATANLSQAKVNLSYASIYSPIDGVVLKRAVNIGQTVAAMFNTPTLFTIAEDLTKMQVEADVDEADLGQVKLGQHVTFTVDAYPGATFEGTVSQIRISPKVTNNVVTYTVIVNAPNPDEKLFPGMTASIRINIESEEGILVPVEALTGGKTLRVKSNGNIEERTIQTGIGDGVSIIARSGVKEGEEVIISEVVKK